MNKLSKVIIVVVVGSMIAYQVICYAAERVTEKIAGVTETGVISSVSNTHNGKKAVKEAIVASQENPGTATVSYNPANGSLATDGWVDISDFNDGIIWHVDVEQFGSTGIDATFEALISDDTSSPILLYTKSFTGTNTSYRLPVAEKGLKYVRLGLQATGTDGTDIVDAKVRAEGERK